jgi:hypothetical protein
MVAFHLNRPAAEGSAARAAVAHLEITEQVTPKVSCEASLFCPAQAMPQALPFLHSRSCLIRRMRNIIPSLKQDKKAKASKERRDKREQFEKYEEEPHSEADKIIACLKIGITGCNHPVYGILREDYAVTYDRFEIFP